MSGPRLPNPLAVRRPSSRVTSSDPHTSPCRSTTRYKTEDSARAHHRARNGGFTPIRCEACGGWHLVKRAASPPVRPVEPEVPRPFLAVPRLKDGERWMPVGARHNEDAEQVIARVSGYPWAPRIVGRPFRVGARWLFRVEGEP